jgi:hypothetical protein
MDLHLNPLVAAGLITRKGDVYRLVADHPVAPPLRHLFEELAPTPAR